LTIILSKIVQFLQNQEKSHTSLS